MSSCRYLIPAMIAAMISLSTADAQAADRRAEYESRQHFERAEAHYREARFAEALAEYQTGYALVPLPGFLINIAQCHRRMGNLVLARLAYRKFLLVAPDSRFVPEVTKVLAELEQLFAEAEAPHAKAKPAQNSETAPAPRADEPSPLAKAAGEPAASRDELPLPDPEMEGDRRISLVAVPAPAEPRTDSRSRWWVWGTVGAVVVAAGAAALFAFRDPGTTTLHDGSLTTLRR